MRDRLVELIQNSVNGCAKHWAEVIADYLLANGVIVPPCKVGDTVYQVDGVRIYESTIDEITYTARTTIYYTNGIAFDDRAIGASIFLTKEEAEKALKGDEGK
jgi:hypothetical protein